MASPLVTRIPTCLSCLRRIAQPVNTSLLTQVRGKKTNSRLNKDAGVVVRLLTDIKGFGKEGSIFRTERGRMRNEWYPTQQAEYMTSTRMKELGLSTSDIGERDPLFGRQIEYTHNIVADAVEAVAGNTNKKIEGPRTTPKPVIELDHIAPNRALELLNEFLPETLTFERRLVHLATGPLKPQAEPKVETKAEPSKVETEAAPEVKLSPLQARRARLRSEAEKDKAAQTPAPVEKTPEELEKERIQKEKEAEELLKIHGSVTLQQIASHIKDRLLVDPEASRIYIQPEDIKFIGLGDGVEKVEKIGSFVVEIHPFAGKAKVESIRRTIAVVAQ